MVDWDRTKPKGMKREEIQNRIAEGLKNWERQGWVRPGFNEKQKFKAIAKAEQPHLDRVGQKRVMQAANLAIYALANGNRQDYVAAVKVINATRRLAGMSTVFMQSMCDGIADAAAAASRQPRDRLDEIARLWLYQDLTPGAGVGRRIYLPSTGANDDGKTSKEEPGPGAADPEGGQPASGAAAPIEGNGGPGDQAGQARDPGPESELQPGEGGQGAGREGGFVAGDPPRVGRSRSAGRGARKPGK